VFLKQRPKHSRLSSTLGNNAPKRQIPTT